MNTVIRLPLKFLSLGLLIILTACGSDPIKIKSQTVTHHDTNAPDVPTERTLESPDLEWNEELETWFVVVNPHDFVIDIKWKRLQFDEDSELNAMFDTMKLNLYARNGVLLSDVLHQ